MSKRKFSLKIAGTKLPNTEGKEPTNKGNPYDHIYDEWCRSLEALSNDNFEEYKKRVGKNKSTKQELKDEVKDMPPAQQRFFAEEMRDFLQEKIDQVDHKKPKQTDDQDDDGVDMDTFNPDTYLANKPDPMKEIEDFSQRADDQDIDDHVEHGFRIAVVALSDLLARIDILEKNTGWLKKNADDHEARIQALEEWKEKVDGYVDADGKTVRVPKAMTPSKVKQATGQVVPNEFNTILQLAEARENIFIWGPTGSGKSHLCGVLAEVLKLPFYAQSCSEGMDETVFTGRLLPHDGGAWKYKPSKFVEFYENGGVYCLDEGDSADANLLTFINTALSNDYFYNELNDGKEIKRHKDFICVMTANTSGHGGDMNYIRNEIDIATMRRFQVGMVHIGYDKTVEQSLIDETVLAWGTIMREVIDHLGIERLPISTGMMIKMTKMKEMFGWTKGDWEKAIFSGVSKDQVSSIRSHYQHILSNRISELKNKLPSGE